MEQQLAQLQARKENRQARVEKHFKSTQVHNFAYYDEPLYEYTGFEVLPAEELGIEEGAMYDRLLTILYCREAISCQKTMNCCCD